MSIPFELDTEDPLPVFDAWFQQAQAGEPNDPNAAALATASSNGLPTVRMVLIKPIGTHRFCFFTNIESSKGIQLTENPHAALCFHWKSLRRQIRVEGTATQLDAADVDTYFHSRSRASQIGAAVSDQSRSLPSRQELEIRFDKFSQAHPGEIPRPPYWRGFQLEPERIEFWINGVNRLHDRFLFTRDGDGWQKACLYP